MQVLCKTSHILGHAISIFSRYKKDFATADFDNFTMKLPNCKDK